ncbi:MAG: hypothetical protein GXZ10_09305 [Gammaproteobacteria bacterium]|nr:hypothetical protein [Gammaproteobacteria bacterium]
MRYLARLICLLILSSAQAFASETQQVELVVFRQGSERLQASHIAPDNWANGATPITSEMLRSTHLNHLVDKLEAAEGYQVLLHKAWLQNSQDGVMQVAITAGQKHFGHYPVEGTLDFTLDRTSAVQLDLWVNQFNPDHTLHSSERFKQKTMVTNDQVTFIDYGTLGALIRIQAQHSQSQPSQSNNLNPEDFE